MLQCVQQLPKLSVLALAGWDHEDDGATATDLSPISNLQHLRHLCLELSYQSSAVAAAALAPAGLTALDLEVMPDWKEWGDAPREVCLSRRSQLQCFRGASLHMRPSSLSAATGLRELRLSSPYSLDGSAWFGGEPRELLDLLQHLSSLRHLELARCKLDYSETYPDGYQCFSALTASTQHTALILEEEDARLLPKASFRHMFPAGRVLPHLEVLCPCRTRCFVPEDDGGDEEPAQAHDGGDEEHAQAHEGGDEEHTEAHDGGDEEHAETHHNLEPEPPWCVEGDEVSQIAASCPALQQLALVDVTAQWFDWEPLLHAAAQLPPAVTSIEGMEIWRRSAFDGQWRLVLGLCMWVEGWGLNDLMIFPRRFLVGWSCSNGCDAG